MIEHLSSLQSAEGFPPVDPSVLLDLERHSRRLGEDLDQMMESLKTSLHAVSMFIIVLQYCVYVRLLHNVSFAQ